MLQNLRELYGHKLTASDGDIGAVKDFYFDDQTWVVRYLVAETGSWLTGRLVLLSPHAFGSFDLLAKVLRINLTRKQIENSPPTESHRTVSRQYECDYFRYYGWPAYWEGSALWGIGGYPAFPSRPSAEMESRVQYHHRNDKHLRSLRAVTGYAIHATDGAIGKVSSLLVCAKSWAIRELVVETGRWNSGKEILISPNLVERISYEESTVFANLTMSDIEWPQQNQDSHAGAEMSHEYNQQRKT